MGTRDLVKAGDITGTPKERVRQYQALVERLVSRVQRLEKTNREQRAVIRSLADRCPSCDERLKLIPWNSEVNILICDNARCRAYHQPQGHVGKKELGRLMKEEPQDMEGA